MEGNNQDGGIYWEDCEKGLIILALPALNLMLRSKGCINSSCNNHFSV
jgi:hypothetical protein